MICRVIELKLVVLRVLEDIQADLSKVKAAIKARIPGCVSSSGSLAYVKSLVLHVSHHILESYISHTLQASSSGVVDISISRVPVEYQSLVAIQWLLDVLSAWSTTYSFQEAMNTLQSTLIPRHTDKITLLDVADPTQSSLLKHFPLVIHLLVYQLSYPNTSPETQSIRITVLATLLEILHTWLHFHVNLESIMKSELDMYPYINTLFILYLGILEVWDTIFTGSINTNMMSISDIFSLNLYPCIHQCDNTREAYYSLFTSLVEVTATFAENHKV